MFGRELKKIPESRPTGDLVTSQNQVEGKGSMNYQIEVAKTGDFLNVAALDRIAWPQLPDVYIPDGEHIWRIWAEHATLLVARHVPRENWTAAERIAATGDVLGALVMFPNDRGELFLHKIMVHPERRGMGIGSQLMSAALERANRPVLLTVNPDNMAAVKLYESFQFRIREHVEGFYRPHEHRYVMEYSPPVLDEKIAPAALE